MVKDFNDFDITENAKEVLITKLTDELIFLRTKLGLSQDELSKLIGISRQTYSTLDISDRSNTQEKTVIVPLHFCKTILLSEP